MYFIYNPRRDISVDICFNRNHLLGIYPNDLFGKIEFKFKSNKKNPLEEVPIKFNDIDNTEIYITDIMGYRYALLLGKGYVVTDECIRDLYIKYTE